MDHAAGPRTVGPTRPAAFGPALVAGLGRASVLTEDGELLEVAAHRAPDIVRDLDPPLLVHAPLTWRRVGIAPRPALDLLELWLFVRPAQPVAPTPGGLAQGLGLAPPMTATDAAVMLPSLARALLGELAAARSLPRQRDAAALAARMGQAGWGWARAVLAALHEPAALPTIDPLRVWKRLPEWEETGPRPPPSAWPVTGAEARARLAAMLGGDAEPRPGQADYAAAAAAAFAPREVRGDPWMLLAEAGTGTGKTLGYVAPASLWAERNHGSVWLSTFTRHLQRQLDTELARLFPDPAERRRRAVVRKGRENYLCLLNFEDAVQAAAGGMAAVGIVPMGLLARWALVSADGDIMGGDLPGWFSDLFGGGLLGSLADRRGECVHSACPHWKRCFVEHTIRRARSADLVVANHALVMAQAAWGGVDDATVPLRYVFDEGHHLFDAADAAFAVELSGGETAELRRWLLGAEGGRSRARGLRRRIEDLVAGNPALETPLDAVLQAARALPGPGWTARLADPQSQGAQLQGAQQQGAQQQGEGRRNPAELFFAAARALVLARLPGDAAPGPAAHEADLYPVPSELNEAAGGLGRALARLESPLRTLVDRLEARLVEQAEELDEPLRLRIEATCRSLRRRALERVVAWQSMLRALAQEPPAPGVTPQHVMFLRLDRRESVERDVGLHRHWLDPTAPFVASLARPAHGILITSATLRDAGERDVDLAWADAEARVGATHLASPALRVSVASPFDYAAQTRAFVVTDVSGAETAALAGAYRALFLAAKGGALGLFTAIRRLQAVHRAIAPALEAAGLHLLAQHVDGMDNATLVDVFRTEEGSCLLGTDAMRDGVDVPGRALRLVVLERVPWPRPDILHRERRIHLSGADPRGYDDRIARFRLRQAFGRLIRTATDRGAFVLLDRQTPSRLLSAFPTGVEVCRLPLADTVAAIREFLT